MDVVAVLGAGGTMGRPIARNLARAGFEVLHALTRPVPAPLEPLAEDGVAVADTPTEAAQGADVLLTMLSDADAVVSSVNGILGDSTWLQMSTIGIAGTERCAELAEGAGVAFVDAPVIGTKAPAEKGELVVLASGPEEVRARVEPIFDVIGQRTMWLGEAGTGSRLKVVVNSWIVAVVEGLAETLALAEGLGLDPEAFLEAIAGGPLDLPYAHMKGSMMIQREFEPSFKLGLAAKDAALVEEAARRHDLDLPLVSAIRRRLDEGAEDHAHEDVAATFRTSAGRGARN